MSGAARRAALPAAMRGFLDWIAWYTLAPRGSALAMGLKLPGRGPGRDVPRVGVRLAGRAAAAA